MSYFIKAAEVWQLDQSGQHLVLGSAHYGELQEPAVQEFRAASQSMAFAINEGLPGQTWAARRPLIWKDLNSDHFRRKALAAQAGLECGLSIPVFAGEFLLGVVVLLCGARNHVSGVVEVWRNRDFYDNELHLQDGFYGNLDRFEFISRRLTLMRGRGLPGTAWTQGYPVIMTHLGESGSFLRARNAAECNLNTGLAIPFFYTQRDIQVVTFLSTEATPVAGRFEVWRPDEAHRYLLFAQGYSAKGEDLQALYRGVAHDRGDSALGQVWLNGRPRVEKSSANEQNGSVYIPCVDGGFLKAIVRFEF